MTTKTVLETTFSTPSDTEVSMTRTFKAPRELVFDVYTKPEHIRNWWGPRDWTMTTCDVDLTVGGAWRYEIEGPDGGRVAFKGVFHEIDRPGRIVNTEIYDDPNVPESESIVTTTFEERDGVTTIVSTARYESQEIRDMVISTGMEDGAAQSFQRIAEIVEAAA